jgi:hypothetical protein
MGGSNTLADIWYQQYQLLSAGKEFHMPENGIAVPISTEHLLSFLFGKTNYHGYVGYISRKRWMKDLSKLSRYIEKSIALNVNSDNQHKAGMLLICDRLQSRLGGQGRQMR